MEGRVCKALGPQTGSMNGTPRWSEQLAYLQSASSNFDLQGGASRLPPSRSEQRTLANGSLLSAFLSLPLRKEDRSRCAPRTSWGHWENSGVRADLFSRDRGAGDLHNEVMSPALVWPLLESEGCRGAQKGLVEYPISGSESGGSGHYR